mmetsp:Transcript_953/g.2425  ORF Transcript_953/g.2425 Transcript_953/m.2425 type:complete len:552 (+) Transcript_953:110-1765(+)
MDKLMGKLKHEAVKLKREAKKAADLETPLERNLREATSNKNWGCPNSVLYELSTDASNYHDRQKILSTVTEKLQSAPDKWRRILKTLTLLEFMIKNGPEQMITELQSMMSMVRRLTGFEFSEEGRERGGAVREKAKALIEIMGDNTRLRQERDQAKEHRSKFNEGASARPTAGGDASYGAGGISSDPSRGGGETRGSMEDRFQELKRKQQQEQANKDREREERMAKGRSERDSDDRRDRDRDDDDRGRNRDNDRDRGERRRRQDDSDDSPRDRNYTAFDSSRGRNGGRSDDEDSIEKPAAKPAPPPPDNLLDLMDDSPVPAAAPTFAPPPSAGGFDADFGDFSAAPAAAPAPAAPVADFGDDFGDFQATATPAPAPVASMPWNPSPAAAPAPFFGGAAAQPPIFGGAPMQMQQQPMGGGYGAMPAPMAPSMSPMSPNPMGSPQMQMGGGFPSFGGPAAGAMPAPGAGAMMAPPMMAASASPSVMAAPAATTSSPAVDAFLGGVTAGLVNLDMGTGAGPPKAPPAFVAPVAAPSPEAKSTALDDLDAFATLK